MNTAQTPKQRTTSRPLCSHSTVYPTSKGPVIIYVEGEGGGGKQGYF